MPVILPEHLFPWLLTYCPQAIPSDDLVSHYWHHMAMQEQIPWVRNVIATGAMYVPIYLWGDDAVYNQRNEKIVAVVCGSWLDERKNSKDTVFPLFTYRSETRLHLAFDEICGTTVHERVSHHPHHKPPKYLPNSGAIAGLRDTSGLHGSSILVALVKRVHASWGSLGIVMWGCGIPQPSVCWNCCG